MAVVVIFWVVVVAMMVLMQERPVQSKVRSKKKGGLLRGNGLAAPDGQLFKEPY